jgi:hypothetical protein
MDVDSAIDLVENPIENLEPGMVFPAVDVHCVNLWMVLTNPVDRGLRGASLAAAGRTGHEEGVRSLAVDDGFKEI